MKIKVNNKIIKLLRECKRILIIGSRPVDMDCLASAVILKHHLTRKSRLVRAVIPSNVPAYLRGFPLLDEVEVYDPKDIDLSKYDLIIALDGCNTWQFAMVENDKDFDFAKHKKVLNIDHHYGNSNFAKLRIYAPECSSTAEIILQTLVDAKKLNSDEATLMYAALNSDTGFFKYNFTSITLSLAAILMDRGADYNFVINQFFYNKEKHAFKVFARLVNDTVYNEECKLSYIEANYKKLCSEFDCKPSEIEEGVVLYQDYFSRAVKDIWISVVEKNVGKIVIVSIRGNNYYNKIPLTKISGEFSRDRFAGGHFNSSVFSLKSEEAVGLYEKLVEFIRELSKKYYS